VLEAQYRKPLTSIEQDAEIVRLLERGVVDLVHGGGLMVILGLLLLANAALHGVIIGRFGIKGNEPPAVFGLLYAGLALAAFRGWAYAAPAVLIVTTVGLLGLAVNFKKLNHETTVEKIIFVVGGALVACAAYLLLIR
jgi:hypothetical protein